MKQCWITSIWNYSLWLSSHALNSTVNQSALEHDWFITFAENNRIWFFMLVKGCTKLKTTNELIISPIFTQTIPGSNWSSVVHKWWHHEVIIIPYQPIIIICIPINNAIALNIFIMTTSLIIDRHIWANIKILLSNKKYINVNYGTRHIPDMF